MRFRQTNAQNIQTISVGPALGILLIPIMEGAAVPQRYIAEQVRIGTLEFDLMKPLNFINHMFARGLGDLGVWVSTHMFPGLLLAFLFLDFAPPANPEAGLAFLLSMALGYLINFYINMLLGLLSIIVTVLLTTHDMSDIEKLCERMMIIDAGRVIYDGLVDGMKERFSPYRFLKVDFTEQNADIQIKGADLVERKGQQACYRFDRRNVSASELILALPQKHKVKDISVEEPEIEAIVREIYNRSSSGGAIG